MGVGRRWTMSQNRLDETIAVSAHREARATRSASTAATAMTADRAPSIVWHSSHANLQASVRQRKKEKTPLGLAPAIHGRLPRETAAP